MNYTVIDSHCHLDYEGLSERLPEVLQAARAAGVSEILSISTRVSKFSNLLRITEENQNIYCTVGTHPHHAHEELHVTADELVRLAQYPRVVGIGEAGLDYHYDFSSPEVQQQVFRTHIAAARKSGLPLVIHAREADDDIARILVEETKTGPFKLLLHCFTSGIALAETGLSLGGYVSFSGILTYKNAENLRTVAARIPMNRLLVETDAPYLAPVPYRGRTNEPAFVMQTLQTLATVKGVSADEMAQQTTDNFYRLFSKVPRDP
jgi:TatD DNase family protein